MSVIKSIFFTAMFLVGCSTFAQTNAIIREGNKAFNEKDFDKAASLYNDALKKETASVPGNFNLGDALYKQGKYDEAAAKFKETIELTDNASIQSKAFHNYGNAQLKQFVEGDQQDPKKGEKLKESIAAYKQALKLNPYDADSRYNLSYAKRLEQQQQQNQDNKDNKDNKDKDQKKDDKKQDQQQQDKKDQEKEKDEQKNKEEQNKDQEQKDNQQQKPQPSEISKEQAEQMLKKLEEQEKKAQDKMNRQKVPVRVKKKEKDW